jgi:CRP-like cAMP-binding protein
MSNKKGLKEISLLQGLTDKQLADIEAVGEYRMYQEGEHLFNEGDEGTHVYCLVSGKVELVVAVGDTSEQVPVHVASDGSVFGEFILFEERPRSATARAVKSAYVFAITGESLKAVFAVDPQAGHLVMTNLCSTLVGRMRKTTASLKASLMW